MSIESEVPESAPGAAGSVHWHVQVFEVRKSITRLFGGRKRVSAGFGWSASGDPEGYEYHPGPFKTRDAAVAAARKAITGLDGTVSEVTDSAVPIDTGG
ncbi:MAG: hypothetical protein QG597_343 [Actinomycetota bacterium]|nr:hypothetical protein [Actinomycetota bacterium]